MPATYRAEQLTPKEIFAAVAPSVYLVIAGKTLDATKNDPVVFGSAVAISAHSALTNCHVVKDQRVVALIDEKADEVFPASLSRSHEASDRCFLRVRRRLKPIAGVRRTSSLEVGERVYTIGNPSGLTKTLGEGLISGLRPYAGITYVQTSAPISQGSSGGALVDSKGALIGITTFLLKNAQSLNFAIAAEDYWR